MHTVQFQLIQLQLYFLKDCLGVMLQSVSGAAMEDKLIRTENKIYVLVSQFVRTSSGPHAGLTPTVKLWQVIEREYHDGTAKGLTVTLQTHNGNLQARMRGFPQGHCESLKL